MAVDITAIQKALGEDGLDGWLLYDFHGSNPIARQVVKLNATAKFTTRRWYYLIPSRGEPRALVHVIERDSLDHLPGTRRLYASRTALADGVRMLVTGLKRVAMEHSPNCAIPYVSRVDAGTVDHVRSLGIDVVSSGDLVQRFEAVWDDTQLDDHREASKRLHRIKDRAFQHIAERLRGGAATTEYDVQQTMAGWFVDEGLITDSPPVVASQASSGNPHYLPTEARCRVIGPDEIVLLDLWGKLDKPGSVFADITWMGYAGARVPKEYATVFGVACEARDAAITLVRNRVQSRQEIRGWEVDRVARSLIDRAGHGPQFVHRTGHSLGEDVHGNGVHMDDYETHDERRLLAGTGFTIEPGIYFDAFGVRTEVNVHVGATDVTVTGPRQSEIVTLG